MKKLASTVESVVTTELDPGIARRLSQFVSCCSVLAVGFGLWTLAGWMFHIPIVKSILPGQVAVKANNAAGFILIGFALWGLRKEQPANSLGKVAAKIAASVVSLLGLLSLLEVLWGWGLHIDQFLFTAGAEDIPGSVRPGLMSPITALCFLLLGPALLLLDARSKVVRRLAQGLSCGVAIASMSGILDFVLDANPTHTYISSITACVLFLFSFGLMFTRPHEGLGSLVASTNLGGTLTRRLFPAAILVPVIVGWLGWKGELGGLYSGWTGITMMALTSAVLLAALTAWTACIVDGSDRAREQTEQDRRSSEEKFRLLLDGVKDYAIYMLDPDGHVISWNAGAEHLEGYQAEEILGKHFSCFYTAKDRETGKPNQELQRANAQGRFEDQGERVRKDGSTFWANCVIAPLSDKSGKLGGFSEVVRDVTERKRAEEALQESETKFRALSELVPQFVWACTPDGLYVYFNQRWVEYTGLTLEESYGRGWNTPFHPDDKQAAWEAWNHALATGDIYRVESRLRRRDDSYRWFLMRGVPVHDASGNIVKWFGTCTDIDDLKRAERALRTLSACNESLVRATDEQNLLQRICDLAVNVGGYRMAWVGYAEHDARKTVRAMAQSGIDASYLDTVNISWADEERGRGPTGTAIRTGIAGACHDVTSDPGFAAWRDNALRRGYRSSLVLPLKNGDEVLGAISIYADEVGAFDAAEQHLLEELSNNLSYGIMAVRATVERRQSEEEIRKLNHELERRVEERTTQLGESERSVRRKLDSILSPEGELGHLELADLLDVSAVQALAEEFYELAHIPMFILDLKGNPVVAAGWQEICRTFHRAHPDSCRNCRESDRELSIGVAPGEFKLYQCKNHLWDVVTPLMLGGQQVGNLFSGQFFFTDETVDREMFRAQAHQYGFDEEEYLAALDRVPRLRRGDVETGMRFYTRLAQLLSQLSYSGIKLARSASQISYVNSELAASLKDLEAFTYSVSHDLRAPLRHISGFSKILKEEYGSSLPAEAQHHLQRIVEGTHRMGMLVDDLLNLARVGRRDLTLQVVGLKSVVEEVVADLAPECEGRQIEWKIGDLPLVECDPGLMKQVFQNLLSNAVKFTRPRTQAVIEVGQKDQDGAPVTFVRDNGVGFNMKYADKLFGVFQRLHRAEDFEGTGVGLATVQRIIQKHGGSIWAEAEMEKGATFYFTLGASEKNEAKTKAAIAGDRV